jgi:hypothetical protein
VRCAGPLLAVALLAAGCNTKPAAPSASGAQLAAPPADPASAAPAPLAATAIEPVAAAPVQSAAPAERQFGTAPKLPGVPVPIATLLATPEPHIGKTVKCEGKVARVCQAAGCWLELQPESGGEGLRVPMAAHAFFIPQDAVGHVAVVEGELKRRELPDAQKAHYAGEGMKAMGPLALEATSVVLR